MNCPQCGTELDAAARFCGACGKKLAPASGGVPRPDGGHPTSNALPARAAPRVVISPAAGSSPAANGQVAPAARKANPAASTEPAPPVSPAAGTPRAQAPVAMGSGPGVAAAVPASPASKPGLPKMGPGGVPGKDPFIGQTLNGRYLIETKLGQGGFGAVYKGKQVIVGREVAIKVLHPEMARDSNLLQRFKREGTVACNLRDAHTVTTYDFDQTQDGVLYIAMELLSGKSLHDIFYDEAPLAWRRVLRVLEQMCSSLGEAHRQGIVHRDIKPENIYLEERPGNPDYVKVLDFGIAKIIRGDIGGGSAPQLTATGQTLGTLEYMSPEQLMGKQLDGRSDIYAMGVLAFELLTGHLPFPDAQGPAELIGAQLKKVPPAPSAANPTGAIPPSVNAIILRMLEKDRSKRYQDVDELTADIVPVLSSNGRPTGPSAAMSASGQTPPPVMIDSRTPPPMMVPAAVVAAAASSPVMQSVPPGQPRPYVLAHTTSESTMPGGGSSKVLLWALIALIVVAGALAGVYFGIIKRDGRNQAREAPPPAAQPR